MRFTAVLTTIASVTCEVITTESAGAASRLIGREPELAKLATFVESAANHGAALLVIGDAGVGKSALLAHAAGLAAGVRRLDLAGSRFAAGTPFSGLAAVFGPLLDEGLLVAAAQRHALQVAMGRDEGAAPSRLQVATAALAVLRHVSRQRPVILVADDVQWLDPPTRDVFLFMARRLAGTRVGMLLATQHGHAHLAYGSAIPVLALRPLDAGAARELLATRFPRLPDPIRARTVIEGRGNPLALLELPAVIAARETDAAGRRGAPAAGQLREVFAASIERLPPATRSLILLAAIMETSKLRRLQAAFPGSLPEALAPAERSGVVRVAGPRIYFTHPLLRTVVVELSSDRHRKAAHRAVAAVFDDRPDQEAWHVAEAAEGPDEVTADRLEQLAVRTGRRGDAAGAVRALTRAAELSGLPQDKARRLAGAALVEASMTGDVAAAVRLLDNARQTDATAMNGLEATTTSALLRLSDEGDISAVSRQLVTALEGPPSVPGDHALGEALWALALACSVAGDPAGWARLRRLLARHASRAPRWLRPAVDLYAAEGAGDGPVGARLQQAVDALAEEDDPAAAARFAFLIADGGHAADLRAVLSDADHPGPRAGGALTLLYAVTARAYLAWAAGDWDECERLADHGITLCAGHRDLPCTWHVHGIRARLAAARGDREMLRALTGQMLSWAQPRRAARIAGLACHALTLDALGRGQYPDACRQAESLLTAGGWPGHDGISPSMALDLTEAAVRGGALARTGGYQDILFRTDPGSLPAGLAVTVRGAMALAAGPREAGALFEVALSGDGAARGRFDWARVCLAYGEHLRQRKSVDQAVERLQPALAIFRLLGAAPWAARTAAELRACGEAVPATDHPRPDLLTAQERRIAEMAASGRSNAEIAHVFNVAAGTVGSHLMRAYRKLGVHSRAALRDALGAEGIP